MTKLSKVIQDNLNWRLASIPTWISYEQVDGFLLLESPLSDKDKAQLKKWYLEKKERKSE